MTTQRSPQKTTQGATSRQTSEPRVTGEEIYLRMLGADVTLEELGAD